MSAKKFKFVSPGVFLSEIDNSQLPKVPGGVGPVIIGRTRRGPALKPVKVSSFQEFVEIFGEPVPGNEGEDPFRAGNGLLATAYAPYAAQAYLKANINSPVTVIRLLGVQGDDASDAGQAGWEANGAFGLFAAPSINGSGLSDSVTGSLVGIIYSKDNTLKVGLGGTMHSGSAPVTAASNYASGSSTTKAVDTVSNSFTLAINAGSTTIQKKVSLREGPDYIRDKLNTNPVATNTSIMSAPSGTLAGKYWLGETFEETYEEVVRSCAEGTAPFVFAAHLASTMADFKSSIHQLSASVTGWTIPQYEGASGSYAPENLEKLFRFHAIQEGEQGLDLNIHIENIKIAETGNPSPYGRFDVVVRQKRGDKIYTVDSYENLSLNPNSDNFIARRIGDQHFEWDSTQKRNKVYGNYPNNSSYVRVEMNGDVEENGPDNPRSVPFGFLGPIKKIDTTIVAAAPKFVLTSWAAAPTATAGTVWISGSDSLTLRWPTAPHVTTGSAAPGLNVNYTLGGTPYNRKTGTNDISYASVNRGMKDYLRKFASYGSNESNTDQASGIADNSNNVHSYIFSLDEVHITGASTPGSDLSNFAATGIEFVSGSHRGGTKATATITCVAEAALVDTKDFTLTDASGITTRFNISTGGAIADNHGAWDATVSSTQNIWFNGATTVANVRDEIITRIEAGTNIGFTAVASGNNVLLTQKTAGPLGNSSITEPDGDTGLTFPAGFTGGKGPKSKTAYTASGSAAALLDLVDSFCMPMAGGSDGVDITEADPFNMSTRTVSGKTTRSSYAYASIDRAIELIRDPEAIEMNLAAMPGITNTTLTTKLIQVCEARADALAVIDLPDVYIPPFEAKCSSFKDRVNNTTPAKSAKNLVARQINSSYGATYYPWVKVRDTINGRDIWAPPSIIALGVMGYTEQRDEVWFAPAGFNRGGLNEGNSGLPVLQVSEQLLSSQRDRLYEANINPIASFVSEGLVVFGQKTLQMTPSALDRINVRRLLIFVKKEISRIANGLLFDQNVPSTWNRFTGQVVPFLEGVKTRLGLTDFKVVLDSTTTTADLIDRNIMYAKIFLKPARAIEFIAVDFVITRTGASFDD